MLNGVSWSLTNELFFYLLFVLALIIPNKKYSLYLLAAYFVFLVVFAVAVPAHADSNQYFQMLIFPMNIEFLLGVSIVLIVNRIPPTWIYPLLVSGIVLFLAGAFLANSEVSVVSSSSNHALNRVLLFGFPAFLIILSVVKLELSSTIKMHNIFLNLGDASYSIYLIHLPIVAAFYKIVPKFNITNGWILTALSILVFIAVCKAGIIIYHTVEKPLIKKLNKLLL
jgi:peptidoglycan/LPS O-acetylase OafA/YrhL